MRAADIGNRVGKGDVELQFRAACLLSARQTSLHFVAEGSNDPKDKLRKI